MEPLNQGPFSADQIYLTVTPEDVRRYQRFDHFLVEKLTFLSRSCLKRLFENGDISWAPDSPLQDKKLTLSKMPPAGGVIEVSVPPPLPDEAIPENIPLEILYEDEHLLFINKPVGLVTHPAPGHLTGTLVNALLYHCPDLKGIGGVKRPGIVHRLDKGTSGVMVVAKTQKCHEELVVLFSRHQLNRVYQAIVVGHLATTQGILESTLGRHTSNRLKMMANPPRGGKKAITHYRVMEKWGELAHLELQLPTGRTHQIRVHLSSLLKSAILMDPLYGKPKEHLKALTPILQEKLSDYPHPLLHARTLGLVHPMTGKDLSFTVPPPPVFSQVLQILQNKQEGQE